MENSEEDYETRLGEDEPIIEQFEEENDEHEFQSVTQVISMNLKQIWQNVLVICLGFMFLFTAFQSLHCLQSSLFREEGMGTTVLSILNGSLVVSSFFIPTPLINFLGCKFSMAVSMACYIFYIAAHFYATWSLFIPGAVVLGLGAAPLWTAKGKYLNMAAQDYAKKKGISHDAATNLFFGVFYLFFQLSAVLGNAISSQVLSPKDRSSSFITELSEQELSLCGRNFDPTQDKSGNNTNLERPSPSKLYTLAGIYTGFACVAVAFLLILLQQLPSERGKLLKCRKQSKSAFAFVATFLHMRDYRQLLLIPITMYSGLEKAFLMGDFTQAFITCPLGSWWVGYVIISYGVMSSGCSLLFGKLVEYVGRAPFFVLGACINVSLVIILLNFTVVQDKLYLYFIFTGLWGVADAVWKTQVNALCGVLFKENSTAAFSNVHLWLSVSFIISYSYQSRLPFPIKAYILLGFLALGMIGYGIVEFIEYKKKC